MEATKPAAPEVAETNVPAELRVLERWIAWQYEWRTVRWEKIPISCRTGRRADITNPSTWASFEEALEFSRGRGLDGVGFVLAKGDPYTGIDLDRCRDPEARRLEMWAVEIARELISYTEVSPSGKGIKILVRGKLPPQGRRTGNIEMYSEGRYFTITGARLKGSPLGVEERQTELDRLHARLFPSQVDLAASSQTPQYDVNPSQTDEEVIEAAMNAPNGVKFARLMAGDTSGYTSVSEADLALCSMLAYRVGPDAERIERLFARAELSKRKKWAKRDDYREMTILKAIESCKVFRQEDFPEMLTRRTRTKQIIRTKQDNTDNKHIARTDGEQTKIGPEEDGEGPSDRSIADEKEKRWRQGNEVVSERPGAQSIVNGKENRVGQGVQIASEYAEDCGDIPDWQASFRLARRLRKLTGAEPEEFEGAVRVFCERSGRPFEEFWYDFLVRWDRVKFAEGEDELAWAAAEAERRPLRLEKSRGEKYAKVASIAFHLSKLASPRLCLANP